MTERAERPATDALGARVRAARTARGISLRRLAGTLGISPATLSQIENDRTGLTVHRLERIAEALGVPATQILDAVAGAEVGAGIDGEIGGRALADGDGRVDGAVPARAGAAVDGTRPAPADWRRYEPLRFDPVLAAALEEFLAIGYHGATVRGIAARAGLSVSGIYHYYTSKQQMLVRILDLTMGELLARAEAARAEGRDPVERFSLLVEHLALFHTHRRELGAIGASEMRSFAPENRHRVAELRTAQQRMVDREVEDAVREGRFRADHPHEAARAVVTMCTALPTWWRPGGPLTPEQVAAQYVGFALDLMRVRPRDAA